MGWSEHSATLWRLSIFSSTFRIDSLMGSYAILVIVEQP